MYEQPSGSGPWTDPAADEIVPGVHRVPLPMPGDALKAVNVYVLEQPDGFTLIDGGWAVAEARATLELSMARFGARPDQIRRVLVTHAHRDHYTLGVELRREFGVTLGLGWGERRSITSLTSHAQAVAFGGSIGLLALAGADDLLRRIVRGSSNVNPSADGWEAPDVWLQPGRIEVGDAELTIVPTPGHTRGHVVFADLERSLLFSGDHVLPHITPSIGVEGETSMSPLKDFLDSLATVRALPDLRLLPAHGPVAPSSHARVDELVTHHDRRLAEVVAVLADGPLTGAEVANRLGWTRRHRAFADLDDFNQMLAVGETVHHLRVLVDTGQVRSRRDGPVDLYTSAVAVRGLDAAI